MTTLDRYVSGLYLRVWLICVLGAPLLFIIIKLTDDLDRYLARGLSIQQVLLAHLYDFPYQMGLSFPVASLFGAVFTVALMSRNFEVTAAKASGVSFYRLIAPLFACEALAPVRVKGKAKPVTILEPLGLEEEMTPEQLERERSFQHFLFLYRSQSWDQAEEMLQRLLEEEPESYLYKLYQERIDHFRENPPEPDWDGVFTHETK